MTDPEHAQTTVGECTVCAKSLPVGANHAYTVCKHLFCIACLLKWHKANPMATCPMCRAPFYEDAEAEAEAFEFSHHLEQERPRMTLEEMDLTQDEQSMHDHLMMIADINASEHCLAHPMCTYMGSINLRTIAPNPENDYHITEFGMHNVNCHYVIELRDASRAFRYKFGRIEDIRMPHPMFQGMSWFVFRELIETLDDETRCMHTVWSHETQLIVMHVRDIISLRQYVPRIRISV